TLHWDGSAWSIVAGPNLGAHATIFDSVAAVSANDVWAVGYSGDQTLVAHWDGTQWSQVSSPSPGTWGNSLYAVTAVPQGAPTDAAWAVGDYVSAPAALIVRYHPLCLTPTPTPTGTPPTNTSTPSPTRTRTPSAGTPTPPT